MEDKRFEDKNSGDSMDNSSRDDTGNERSSERGNRTEFEQPNPAIATPGIPVEMPAREIR
jgi:hypothetical protein